MEITRSEIIRRASAVYADGTSERCAYIRGFTDALEVVQQPQGGMAFLEAVATGLRKLWPAGEKDGKWPWRDSVPNIQKRLEFIWKYYKLGDNYTVEQCLRAGRRYLAQFEGSCKYMMLLKYFIFKQEKIVGKDGRITYTYKSVFADYLTSDDIQVPDADETEVALNEFGEVV